MGLRSCSRLVRAIEVVTQSATEPTTYTHHARANAGLPSSSRSGTCRRYRTREDPERLTGPDPKPPPPKPRGPSLPRHVALPAFSLLHRRGGGGVGVSTVPGVRG